jgi:hypothetical protein
MMRVLAILLIILGILGLGYQTFTYAYPEKVVDVGGLKVFAQREHTVWIPPVVSGAAVLGGVALLVADASSRRTTA